MKKTKTLYLLLINERYLKIGTSFNLFSRLNNFEEQKSIFKLVLLYKKIDEVDRIEYLENKFKQEYRAKPISFNLLYSGKSLNSEQKTGGNTEIYDALHLNNIDFDTIFNVFSPKDFVDINIYDESDDFEYEIDHSIFLNGFKEHINTNKKYINKVEDLYNILESYKKTKISLKEFVEFSFNYDYEETEQTDDNFLHIPIHMDKFHESYTKIPIYTSKSEKLKFAFNMKSEGYKEYKPIFIVNNKIIAGRHRLIGFISSCLSKINNDLELDFFDISTKGIESVTVANILSELIKYEIIVKDISDEYDVSEEVIYQYVNKEENIKSLTKIQQIYMVYKKYLYELNLYESGKIDSKPKPTTIAKKYFGTSYKYFNTFVRIMNMDSELVGIDVNQIVNELLNKGKATIPILFKYGNGNIGIKENKKPIANLVEIEKILKKNKLISEGNSKEMSEDIKMMLYKKRDLVQKINDINDNDNINTLYEISEMISEKNKVKVIKEILSFNLSEQDLFKLKEFAENLISPYEI